MNVNEVFSKANLSPRGPVRWGTKISESGAGVYVVARVDDPNTDCATSSLPFIDPLPSSLELDRSYEEWRWLPNEAVVYVGMSDRSIETRIAQFYTHKIGSPSPHAGGQILKLLECDLWVYWAPSATPLASEKAMLAAFVDHAGKQTFGNGEARRPRRIRCDKGWLNSKVENDAIAQARRIKLPEQVSTIYRAVAELEAIYPRKFTPDGHLVGSIGEVVAAEALGLTLYDMSHAGHDAYDANGDVQIKMTAGSSVSMYCECNRLVVLRVVSPEEAEIVYDGPGKPAWEAAGKQAKNGQKAVSLAKLRKIGRAT